MPLCLYAYVVYCGMQLRALGMYIHICNALFDIDMHCTHVYTQHVLCIIGTRAVGICMCDVRRLDVCITYLRLHQCVNVMGACHAYV